MVLRGGRYTQGVAASTFQKSHFTANPPLATFYPPFLVTPGLTRGPAVVSALGTKISGTPGQARGDEDKIAKVKSC